ncbi:MAG: hypothetical protein R2844_06465 [Caldilineales bacterium]
MTTMLDFRLLRQPLRVEDDDAVAVELDDPVGREAAQRPPTISRTVPSRRHLLLRQQPRHHVLVARLRFVQQQPPPAP